MVWEAGFIFSIINSCIGLLEYVGVTHDLLTFSRFQRVWVRLNKVVFGLDILIHQGSKGMRYFWHPQKVKQGFGWLD
jgi:hypothetical protein